MTDSPQHIKSLVSQYWSQRAIDFDQGPTHGILNETQHQAWRRLLQEVVGSQPVKALDVGCGTGFLAMLLGELGHTALGVDLADDMLAQAQRKAAALPFDVTFCRGDAENPPRDGAPYDVIIERHVIWTLPQPQLAVQAWHALLKPGGQVILIEGIFGMPSHTDTIYTDIRDQLPFYGGHPSDELVACLESQGFVDTSVKPLMEAALWVEAPQRPRFMVMGRRPVAG
jgi:ubiquinone/menaquinone biosynthesis C-methylase UbiE